MSDSKDERPFDPVKHARAMLGDPNPTRFLTYGQLKKAAMDWPPEVLNQYVQIAPPVVDLETPLIMMPVFAARTVGDMLCDGEGDRVQTTIRFPDGADDDGQMVLFTDWNPAAITTAVSEGIFDTPDDPLGGIPTDDILEMVEGGLAARGRSLYNIARRNAGFGCVIFDPAWVEGGDGPPVGGAPNVHPDAQWLSGLRVSAYHPTLREALTAELRALGTEADEELKRGGGPPMEPRPQAASGDGGPVTLVLIEPPPEED